MIATHGVDISVVPSLPGQGTKPGAMHGASWSAATSGVSSLSAPAETVSPASRWQTLLASLGMVGDAGQDGTTTDSTSASGAAQALPGDKASGKSASRPGSTLVPVLEEAQGTASTKANNTTLLASIAQPAIGSANLQVRALGTGADSTKTSSQAKTQTAEGAHETRVADSRREAKKDGALAEASQVEAAVQVSPVAQAAVLPVPVRTGSALDSTPSQFARAAQTADMNGATAAASTTVVEKTATTLQTVEKLPDQPADTSSISHSGSSPTAQFTVDAEVDEGTADASATQTGQGIALPQAHAAKTEGESLSFAVQNRPTASSPESNAHSSLYPTQTAGPLQPDAAASLSESVSIIGKASAAAVAQPEMSRSGRVAAVQTAHLTASQTASAANETFNLSGAQNLSEVHAGAANGGSIASTPASVQTVGAASASKEPFAAMDSGSGTAAPTWVHAGARQAEAGFQDSSLGWVGVRAQADGNVIHATVVPGSAEAAQSLAGHLAGLNTYLADHHTPVETLTLDSPESRWAGQGMEQGTGQQAGQGAGQGDSRGQEAGYSSVATGSTESSLDAGPATGGVDLTALAAPPGGVYISVMA